MKKTISLFLVAFLMLSTASGIAEVTFNDVSFLSTDEEVIATLISKELAKKDTSSDLSNENNTYLVANELLGFQPSYVQDYQTICFSQTIPGFGKIAGWPVKDLILTYAYDGKYKLIAVKVELIGANYTTLLEKLTKVYGVAEVKILEGEGVFSNIWKDRDTAVILYTESEGYDYSLIYGRTDAEEILQSCLAPADPDDVSGL